MSSRSLFAVLGLCLLLIAPLKAEEPIEAFETRLDFTIRSACHGYMIDAIPDFLDDVREWLNKNTPFCQTVRTLKDDESAYDLLTQQNPAADYRNGKESPTNLTGGYNADLYRHSDCNDWMCQHVRDQAFSDGHPISLADYKKVEQHCKGPGEYSCIESWFKTWPRPLPVASSAGLSLDSLMGTAPAQKPTTTLSSGTASTSSTRLSLDAMLGTAPAPSAPTNQLAAQTPIKTNKSSTGLSLDDTFGTPSKQAKSADISLDNVFAGREQLALEKSLKSISSYNGRLSSDCGCSLENSGCYQLPSESLLESANNLEQKRYSFCGEWQNSKSTQPKTAAEAQQLIGQLAKLERNIEGLDDDMETQIDRWEEQRRRMIAQQQREAQTRADSAYLAGMASILMQAGAVNNGSISAHQAAQNAFNVSQGVERGESWGSAMSRNIVSSIPNQMAANQAANTSTNSTSGQTNSTAPSVPKPSTNFAVCKTESSGTALTAGCIGLRNEGNGQGCSGSICGSNIQEVCQKVGAARGVPFQYFASGLGTFSTMGQCVAKCENDYGAATWGEYGRKCLGAVSQ